MKARRGPGSDPGPMRPMAHRLELFGLAEIAELTGYQGHKERLRKYLPEPDYVLRMGPIWTGDTVRPWLREWRRQSA